MRGGGGPIADGKRTSCPASLVIQLTNWYCRYLAAHPRTSAAMPVCFIVHQIEMNISLVHLMRNPDKARNSILVVHLVRSFLVV